jgi:predicted alpha/beta superfamily hydrolase
VSEQASTFRHPEEGLHCSLAEEAGSGAILRRMNLSPAAKWLLFASAVLVGCGAIEPPPQEYPYVTVTFDVTVPADTSADAVITVVGSSLALGSETAPGFKLRRQADGHYTGLVRMPQDSDVSYDIWQGDVWIPEVSAGGTPLTARRTLRAEGDMTVAISVARWGSPSKGPAPGKGLMGIIRYHRGVSSAFLSRSRDVIVYLPPDYFDSPERRYPVLYMHDGQNLMDASTANSGEWRVDETAEQLIQGGTVEPLIIVGVSNTPDRIAEYTPVSDARYGGGNADNYGRFLVEELKPMIDARYRTRPGPEDTGLAGSSLGGLVSLYLGLKYPDTFTRLGVISPSVWWANEDIVTRVKALDTRPPLRLWVDMGSNEDKTAIAEAQRLRDALVAEGWGSADLKYVEVEGAGHNEGAWSARFGDVLRFLFPPR